MAEKQRCIKNAHLSHLSRHIKSLQDALKEDEPDVITVKKYTEMVEITYNKVLSYSNKIKELLTEDTDIANEIEAMYTLEENVREIRCTAEHFLQGKASDNEVKGKGIAHNVTLQSVNTLQK